MQRTPFFLVFLAMTVDSYNLAEFSGYWESNDPQNEIAAIQISLNGNKLTVHAWARCEPGICEWGDANAVAATQVETVRTAHSISATYTLPDRQVVLILRFEDTNSGRIQVMAHTHFMDKSGRLDLVEYDSLEKGKPPELQRPSREPQPPNPVNPPRPPRPPAPPNGQTVNAVRQFPWPPPPASAFGDIPRSFLSVGRETKLRDANAKLVAALDAGGYFERNYYPIPGGFALVTQLEQIQVNGAPAPKPNRWAAKLEPLSTFSLWEYLKALFTARPGRYRIIVFAVTSTPFGQYDKTLTKEEAARWVSKGWNQLPGQIGNLDFTDAHTVTALIYEFEEPEPSKDAVFIEASSLDYKEHLVKSSLWDALRRKNSP